MRLGTTNKNYVPAIYLRAFFLRSFHYNFPTTILSFLGHFNSRNLTYLHNCVAVGSPALQMLADPSQHATIQRCRSFPSLSLQTEFRRSQFLSPLVLHLDNRNNNAYYSRQIILEWLLRKLLRSRG